MIKQIPGFPEYGASEDGKIWRLVNGHGCRTKSRGMPPYELNPRTQRSGHKYVSLRNKHYRVHCLVLTAFCGPRPDGMVGAHSDGNPANNGIFNLRWCTPKENGEDMVGHGRSCRGERQGLSKLAATDIPFIRSHPWKDEKLAKFYNVDRKNIAAVRTRKSWRHIT